MPNPFSKIKKAFKRKKEEEPSLEEAIPEEEKEAGLTVPRLTERTERLLRANLRPVDLYPLYQPWAYAHIAEDLKTGRLIYLVEEVTLNEQEAKVFHDIVDYITWELEPPKKASIDTREYIMAYAKRALRLFQIKLGRTPGLSWSKIGYYVERNLLGYGPLDPIFRDENIEDISCNGPRKPVYVWHRKYESLPTNIMFESEEELDEYVLKLAHMAGKHISVAYPILDAILPGGHRVAATFQKEVSTGGSTFTVRKFREDPITIIDMINFGTISPEIAAYFWLAMDYKMTSLILGVTGAGKTSTLNALANLLRPTYKVVTIEDTPELRLPQENWVQLVSRPSYLGGGGIGEITLFHLVKVSLRYRPDVIVVGEVRGEEAYVLFQAIASVSWDTPILLRDEVGNIQLVPIGAFIDSYYAPGEERVAKKAEGYYVLSHDGYRAIWKPIQYVLRHSTGEIYEVEFEGGGKLKATGSHSVFVMDPETLEIAEKPVSDLTPGELLVSFRKRNGEERKYAEIDVIDEVGDTEKDYVDNIPKEMKIITGRNPIKLTTYLKLEKSKDLRRNLKIRRWTNSRKIPAVIKLDEDFAYLLGAYLADGNVYRRKGSRIIFSFGKEEKKEIGEKVVKIMEEKFGLTPYIMERGSYILIVYSNTVLAELIAKLAGTNLKEKKVPKQLWESPTSVVKAFFEGLKADSRRTLRRRYVSYTTSSKTLAEELLWLSRLHGLYGLLIEEKGTGKNEGKTYYTVNIYLEKAYRKPNTAEKIPAAAILKLIKEAEPRSMPLELTYIKRRKYLSHKIVRKILDWVKKKGSLNEATLKLMEKIRELMYGDLIISEVRQVRKTSHEGYVYDISVPDTESFFGGNVPTLLHNTGHSGLTTLHSESIDAAVKRLTSAPMNIPPSYIPLVNMALVIKRIILHKEGGRPRPVRRITNVWEIKDYNEYVEVAKWDPVRDRFDLHLDRSVILDKITELTGRGKRELIEEVGRRKIILEWLATNMIRSYKEVATYVQKYYLDPYKVLKEIGVKQHG